MLRVILGRELGRRFAGGQAEVDAQALTVRALIGDLEQRFPGIGAELRSGMAVAIDGEIHADPFLESLEGVTEVCFLPPIGGG